MAIEDIGMNAQQAGRLIERVEHIAGTVERIDHTVNGNGKEGLVVKVDRHDHTLKNAGRFLWIIMSALVTAAVAALVILL
jgi:hypothetical protein